MTDIIISLDESGDLGWKFDRPYRNGGSSRFLTIAALSISSQQKAEPKRLVKKLYQKHSWNPQEEKKWADMRENERLTFSSIAHKFLDDCSTAKYFAITVNKERVQDHIRIDPNKLYNYMVKLLLIEEMALYREVTLVPDPRSTKVASGNSLGDYLQTELWFTEKKNTILSVNPCDSHKSKCVQFADMLSGAFQASIEDNKSHYVSPMINHSKVRHRKLYF